MNLYFADRKLMIKGMGSTAIDAPYLITDDLYKEDVGTGLATLEFDLHYSDMSDSQIQEMVAEGNYILYDGLQGQTTFIILEMERDPIERKVYIYAEDAGIDLINEVLPEFAAPKDPQGIIFYIDQMGLLNEGYEVVRNEVSKKTRTLSFSSGQTGTQRLAELANSFGAEVKFRFEFVGLNISRRFIDIYERRGKQIDIELRLGREIENIVEKRSISNIATALWAIGSPIEVNGEEGDPITLNDTVYDDGNFYTVNGSYLLKSRSALSRWGRFGASGDYNYAHVIRMFSYDTTDKTELLNRTIEALKKASEPEVTYSVSLLYLPENLELGDTVNLVDDKSGLYLGARLLKLEVSEANDTRNAEFGEYIVKTSGINQDLFKDVDFSKINRYTWVVYADTANGGGISLSEYSTTGRKKKYMGIASNKLNKDPVLDPTIYKWTRLDDENVVDIMNFVEYVTFNPTYEIFTDPSSGIKYYVDLATGNKYKTFEDENGPYYIDPDTGRKTYFVEGLLWEMTEEEEAEYREQWEQYKANTTAGQGVYYIHNDDGSTDVKIISDQIDTNGLSINGQTLAEYISSQVGYRIKNYTKTYSISANGIINLSGSDLNISTPDGYTPVAVLSAKSGNGNVVVRTFNGAAVGSAIALSLKNTVSTAIDDLEANIDILYASTNLSGGGSGGGGEGTLDYNQLYNKPQIEEVTLQGNKYIEDLGINRLTNSDIESMLALTDMS